MTNEELEKKAEEYQTGRKDLNYFSDPYKNKIRKAYIAGAKEMQEENEQLKTQIEKMKCCGNCKYFSEYTGHTGDAFFCEKNNFIIDEMQSCDKWELLE